MAREASTTRPDDGHENERRGLTEIWRALSDRSDTSQSVESSTGGESRHQIWGTSTELMRYATANVCTLQLGEHDKLTAKIADRKLHGKTAMLDALLEQEGIHLVGIQEGRAREQSVVRGQHCTSCRAAANSRGCYGSLGGVRIFLGFIVNSIHHVSQSCWSHWGHQENQRVGVIHCSKRTF